MPDSGEIAVVGVGTATGTPDHCVVSLVLNVAADTSGEALAGVTRLASKVVAVLLAHEIPASNIQTTNLAVRDFHDSEKKRVTARIASYGLTVYLDALAQAGPLLTALAEAAGDSLQVQGLGLQIGDPKPLMEAARRAAVADALDRARQLADAAGLTLGGIRSIEEGPGIPVNSGRRLMSRTSGAIADLPLEGGTASVMVQVSVRMSIVD
jgi:uncharacterized protein YggE